MEVGNWTCHIPSPLTGKATSLWVIAVIVVQVFDQQGQFVRYLATNLGSVVTGLAMTPSGDVWVALRNLCTIQLLNGKSGELIRSFSCEEPFGIALLPDGSLTVACWTYNNVVVFNADGGERWSSTGDGFDGVSGLVAVDNDLFVCDGDNDRIQVLSIVDGHFVRQMGGAGQMSGPCGIAFDSITRLLLVAEFDNVSVWSLDGQRLHRWGSMGDQPGQFNGSVKAITVAANGTVYVADTDNYRIQVF